MKISLTAAIAVLAYSSSAPAQQLAQKATREVLRHGGPAAPDPYAFPVPPRLVLDETNHIYARIPPDGTVLVFDRNGTFVRRIGRRGTGPGEFQHAAGHGFAGDTLWVLNWPTPRISKFTKAGAHIETVRTPYDFGHAFGAGPTGLSGLLAGGRAYAIPPSPVLGVQTRITLPLLLGATGMRTPDTIALLPNPHGLFVPGIGTWTFDPVPRSPLVGIDPRGHAVVLVSWDDSAPNAISVRVVAPGGDTRWERRFPVPVAAIPRSVRDSLITVAVQKVRPQIEAAQRGGTAPPGSVRDLASRGLSLPEYYAPARRVVVGIDGSVWIERTTGLEGGLWFVVGSTGTPLFLIRVPRGFELEAASMESLWGVETDALGVAYLVKLLVVDR